MLAVAFKRGSSIYSEGIRKVTGGEFSHVELVLSYSQDLCETTCYSSREPEGSSIRDLNLSDPKVWEVVPLNASFEDSQSVDWFCKGSAGRPYDFIGIAGILADRSSLHVGCARFCSNEVTNVLQAVLGLFPGIDARLVAPDWRKPEPESDGRRGLYQLLKGLPA